jgi:transcriptional regulator with XRE-family HTH domain
MKKLANTNDLARHEKIASDHASNMLIIRNSFGLSLQDVQDLIGIPKQTLSNYERKTREPNIHTLKLLADFYNVSVDVLIGHEPTVNSEQLSLERISMIANRSAKKSALIKLNRNLQRTINCLEREIKLNLIEIDDIVE